MRTMVVLPAPFGPSSPNTVPRGTSMSTPSRAWTSPKYFLSPWTMIAASANEAPFGASLCADPRLLLVFTPERDGRPKRSAGPEARRSRSECSAEGLADLALQAVGEAGHHGGGNVLHHAPAVLGDGPRHVDVLADLDVGRVALVGDLGNDVGVCLALALLLATRRLHDHAPGLVVELGDGDGAGEGEVHGPHLDLHLALVGLVVDDLGELSARQALRHLV